MKHDREKSAAAGCDAYISKPLRYQDLYSGLRTALMETSLRRKDGALVHVEVNRQALGIGADWTIVDVVRDIAERKDAQRRLLHF